MADRVRKRKFVPWLLALAALVWLAISLRPYEWGSVLSELIQSQDENGLTLAWVDGNSLSRAYRLHLALDGVEAISFGDRTVVHLQDSLQDFRPDAFSWKEYPRELGIGGCWSHDQKKLATGKARSMSSITLEILDLDSKQDHPFGGDADGVRGMTSQCWSLDDQKLVYETGASVMVFDVKSNRSDALAKGVEPTWSPDGKWIAFRDGDTYYAIHPDGSGRKKLFHNYWGSAVSGLYWSPDSRIVAYVRELGFLQGGALDAGLNQLRVRRLKDGSDTWLCRENVGVQGYRWITNRELANHKS
jgi:WD40-like Beta Propeller Repeat